MMIPLKIRETKLVDRLTNNPVEGYFGNLKSKILDKIKQSISVYVVAVYKYFLSKYLLFFPGEEAHKKALRSIIEFNIELNNLLKLIFDLRLNTERGQILFFIITTI